MQSELGGKPVGRLVLQGKETRTLPPEIVQVVFESIEEGENTRTQDEFNS